MKVWRVRQYFFFFLKFEFIPFFVYFYSFNYYFFFIIQCFFFQILCLDFHFFYLFMSFKILKKKIKIIDKLFFGMILILIFFKILFTGANINKKNPINSKSKKPSTVNKKFKNRLNSGKGEKSVYSQQFIFFVQLIIWISSDSFLHFFYSVYIKFFLSSFSFLSVLFFALSPPRHFLSVYMYIIFSVSFSVSLFNSIYLYITSSFFPPSVIHSHTHTHTHTYIHTSTYIHTYIHIHIHTYIHTHMHK